MKDTPPAVSPRASARDAERWLAAVAAIAAGLVLLLSSFGALVNRELAWTASRTTSGVALPSPRVFADSDARFAAIDRYVADQVEGLRVPGLSLAIVHGRQIVHRRAFGRSGPGTSPVGASPFILGSLSKSVTALAVMQLVEAGRMSLDAPAQRYLPWFVVRDSAASTRITVRQLLNHTSGIPRSAGLRVIRGAEAATRPEERRLMARTRLDNAPGTAFEYSNANYWLLGLIVEAVAHTTYEAYVVTHVFVPLGMAHSYTNEVDAEADGLATGHRVWFGFPRAEVLPYYQREVAVGYLISTADDMGRYLVAQLNGGSDGGAEVVSAAGLHTLHTPPIGSPYAMGWLVDSVAGRSVLWHTGAVANYHADMLLVPADAWGVVMLSNVNNFLLEDQLSAAIKGVATLLIGYDPPPSGAARYRGEYWAMSAAAVLWLIWRIVQIATLRHWRSARPGGDGERAERDDRPPRHPAGALVDPGIAIGLVIGLPLLVGSPLPTLHWFVPDLTDWMLANAAIALMVAGARLALQLGPSAEARPVGPREEVPGAR